MTTNDKDYMIISVNVPRKIVGAIDKMVDMKMILSRTEFARNAIINEVKRIANLKEMIDVLNDFEIMCEKKGLSDEAEAKKYFKWLKNGVNDVNVIAKINETEPVRVKELLLKHFNIKLDV